MRTLPSLTIVAAGTLMLVACESGPTETLVIQTPPAALTVIPTFATIDGGKVLRLTAKLRREDGSLTEPPDVIWSSANPTIASVDSKGTVQAWRAGRAQISATWHDSHGSSLVTVLDPVVKKEPRCLEPLHEGAGTDAMDATC